MKQILSKEQYDLLQDFLKEHELSAEQVINSMYHELYTKAAKICEENPNSWIFVNGTQFIIHTITVDYARVGLESKEEFMALFSDRFRDIVEKEERQGYYLGHKEKYMKFLEDYYQI